MRKIHSIQLTAAAFIAASIALGSASPSAATEIPEDWRSPDGRISVDTPSRYVAARICTQAARAREFLDRCGIHGTSPVRVSLHQILGRQRTLKSGEYDPRSNRIRLLSHAAFVKAGRQSIGGTHVLMRILHASIATHEVAHAIFYEHSIEANLPETAHEYVAYVVQLSTLPADVRDKLAKDHPSPPITNLFAFSHFLLYADPERFALQAWHHFNQPENGCDFLQRIVERKLHFPPIGD